MERNNTLSKELEECWTKLNATTAELENLKKSKKAPDGKHNSVRKIWFCADNDFWIFIVLFTAAARN